MRLRYASRTSELVLEITGKFNVIMGESGTGKTLLTEIAQEFSIAPSQVVQRPLPIYTNRVNVLPYIQEKHNAVIVIDEGYDYAWFKENIELMKRSDNFYILITRDGIPHVPYGIDNTFKVGGGNRRLYMIPMYATMLHDNVVQAGAPIQVEDEGLGFELLRFICKERHKVFKGSGNSDLPSRVQETQWERRPLVVFDSCGIGPTYPKLLRLMEARRCDLYYYVSLEHEILIKSFPGRFKSFDLAAAAKFPSEEDYYTQQLNGLLHELAGIAYKKSDSRLVDLLENGVSSFHDRVVILRDMGGMKSATFSEFRIKVEHRSEVMGEDSSHEVKSTAELKGLNLFSP